MFDRRQAQQPGKKAHGDLGQHAGAVTGAGIGCHAAAMFQIGQRFDGHADDFMAASAGDVGHETNAAGIVFVTRVVKRAEGSRVKGWWS